MYFLMESPMSTLTTLMLGGMQQASQHQKQASQHQKVLFSLPFDMAREQYSKAVRAGLMEKSLIASARFERALSALEVCTLGPWAR